MPDRNFSVDIVTPERVVLRDTATSLGAPGVMGGFGILSNHAPFMSELTTGELRYRRDTGEEVRMAVSGGFLQVYHNQVTVLADTAERAEEIDAERARLALQHARDALEGFTGSGAERDQLQGAVDRALNRLRVSGAR